jgi:hypothetical protein
MLNSLIVLSFVIIFSSYEIKKKRIIPGYFLCLFCIAFLFPKCKPRHIDDPPVPAATIKKGEGFFVCNEGNFGSGNAGISYINTVTNKVEEDIYKTQNSESLGDVCQSMSCFNNKFYIVVNNSSKIEIVDAGNFKKKATINGFTSPRYFLPVSASKAYVTDIYSNKIFIVDLNQNIITGSIPCIGWTETLLSSNSTPVVLNVKSKSLYLLDALNDRIGDSIVLPDLPASIALDATDKDIVWILTKGDSTKSISNYLLSIRISSKQIISSLNLNTYYAHEIHIDEKTNMKYWFDKGMMKMELSSSPVKIINEGTVLFYHFNVSNGTIYIADAIDYIQKSNIYLYDDQGIKLKEFKAGIISGEILIY